MLLVELEREARRRVREVRDQPQGRLRLREVFYENYGFPERAGVARHGFGKSELDFLAWEIERGVLNSPQHPEKPGSPWWRAVNEDFLYWGELAALVQGSQLPQGQAPRLVRHWLRYIKEPSAVTWYRAHNASIIQAYLDHVPRAMQESPGEQLFMNVVLYRVLYAQAMVEGCDYAFADLGRLLANPCFPAVHVLLELPDFYPRSYPLSEQEVRDLMHCGHDLADVVVDVFDEFFILPNVQELYQEASGWNQIQDLLRLVEDRRPVYPRLALWAEAAAPRSRLRRATDRLQAIFRFLVQIMAF